MPRKTPGPPCIICRQPSVARGFCDKHYRRWKQFGDATRTLRPDDWGRRSNHPLNETWAHTRRNRYGRVEEWNDFWRFVEDVGERPSPDFRLRRLDNKQPFGPENFHWQRTLQGRHHTLTTAEGRAEYQRVWRANNRLRSKSNDLKKSYGITLEEYDKLLESQGGGCAICGGKDERFKFLPVDHCHKTKKVRGLLCQHCNRGLGYFRDSPELLRAAIAYLGT